MFVVGQQVCCTPGWHCLQIFVSAIESGCLLFALALPEVANHVVAVQMVGTTFLLYGIKAPHSDLAEKAISVGLPLLVVAAAITLASLTDYFRKLWAAL